MKAKAVLFDLDGVLVDTEGIYTQIWSSINEKFPTGKENFALAIKGMTLPNILSTYFAVADHNAVVAMLEKSEKTMPYPLFPKTMPFLDFLRSNNIPAAIVTSSNDSKIARLFSMYPGFRDHFAAVVTDSHVSHGKPDPEGYLLGARLLGTDIKDCVVIEDSINGLIAGRNAGARLVAMATTNPPELLRPFTTLIADNFDDSRIRDLFQ